MSLTVLSVAYPFARVAPDTAGGAEQILSTLDRALTSAGHTSLVLGQEDSQVAGSLIAMPRAQGEIDAQERQRIHSAYAEALAREIGRRKIDLVHMHGVDFQAYLPPPAPPVLVTLHLPIACYAPGSLQPERPDTFFHCVSAAQHRDAGLGALLPPIENGVDIDAYARRHAKRGFALMLARICPEKGVHLALDAARLAGVPLLVGGHIFPYTEHREYFAREIEPRLDATRRYIGLVGPTRKRRLLSAARCVLVASTIAETSSLVAREALAAGTPVIALARGALIDTVEHGRTGFLVSDVTEMAAAIARTAEIDPSVCRASARARFSDRGMIARYFDLYDALAGRRVALFGDAA